MKWSKNISRLLIASLTVLSCSALACTDFKLISKDGTVIVARSMEFAYDMKSNMKSSNRGRQFTNTTPNGSAGLSWKAIYGYLLIDGFGKDITIDGINEKGLSFEYLYLPGETQYQTVPSGHEKQALAYSQLGDWILGNFKTIDEVRAKLADIFVYGQKLPGMGDMIFPVHAAIYDASGRGIIVEFVKGKMKLYDNKIGLLTNSPTYDWQLTNLRNYINLTPFNPVPVIDNNIIFAATGQGSGMMGLPGDVSPPSRFVKVALMLKTIIPTNNAAETVNMAQHIINNVDIPLGFVREAKSGKATNDLTQWVVFKDLTHRTLYFRTYQNLNLRAVSLDNIDFSENASRLKMPLATEAVVQDVTAEFMKKAS